MKYLAIAITAALVLTACGKEDGSSSNGAPALIAASISGIYQSADGKTTFNFSNGKLQTSHKVGKGGEYKYSTDGNSVKWTYEATGVAESCEIKESTTIYCAVSRQSFTKIN